MARGSEVEGRRPVGSLADFGLRADAARADVEAPRLTIDRQGLDLHVGPEGAVRPRRLPLPAARVLVADVAAESGALAADLTFSSHGFTQVSKSIVFA
jgi:hypothetical protein